MAYYDALIAACRSTTQPPSGVTGSAYSSGLTPDQKLTVINGWTVVGPSQIMSVATTDIYNVIVPSEWNALGSSQQQNVRDILYMGSVNASAGTNVRAMLVLTFPSSTATRTNLLTLAAKYDSPQIPWWQGIGYPNRISGQDLVNAGLV